MDLKSYTLAELESHVEPALSGSGGIVPLSPLRLISYLKNPRAGKSDHLLFELRHEGRLVAYRTLLPDYFYDKKGILQQFAWLSGNYVDPDFRREGLSTKLLQLAEAQWDGRLMYTNYAPASKALYDRTGQFPVLAQKDGKRFYLRSASKELLGNRLGSRELLKKGDQMVNRIREGKLQKFQPVDPSICRIERITTLDQEVVHLIRQSQGSSLFRRDDGIFSWILDHPWVTRQDVDTLNYQFTYKADKFENLLLKFILPGNKGLGLLWLVIHNQKLSAPYLFIDNEDIYPLMARTLIHTMITHGSAYSTIHHPELLDHLVQHKKWFLSLRNMPQLLFAHKKIIDLVPDNPEIHDGDGDVVFTG
ncbi:MAG: GNAT family N-acetyltransferase [Bacteroidota bacterium]